MFRRRIQNWLQKIESIQPFSETEAWGLFRLAAFAEAIGWAILIAGIVIRDAHNFGSGVAVPIAGRIHGMFFLTYFAVLIATSTSLRWRPWQVFAGLLLGVPPFGSLVFEQLMAYGRANRRIRQHFRAILLSSLTRAD